MYPGLKELARPFFLAVGLLVGGLLVVCKLITMLGLFREMGVKEKTMRHFLDQRFASTQGWIISTVSADRAFFMISSSATLRDN